MARAVKVPLSPGSRVSNSAPGYHARTWPSREIRLAAWLASRPPWLTLRAAARPIRPGSRENPSMVDQQVSAIVIIVIGMASPKTVTTAGTRRVSESRAPRTRAGGRWTSRPNRASRDR